MRALFQRLNLPLLSRELTEQGLRIRTYQVRAGFACLLCLPVLISLSSHLDAQLIGVGGILNVLGIGASILSTLYSMLLLGIYLFLPPMMATSFTVEKERNTLGLLLITNLGTRAIILEKWLSRLLPMITLLLIALPIAVLLYSLGGITPRMLFNVSLGLFVNVLQVSAVGLFLSVWCRSLVSATLMTYLTILGLFIVPPMVIGITTGLLFPSFSGIVFQTIVSWLPSDWFNYLGVVSTIIVSPFSALSLVWVGMGDIPPMLAMLLSLPSILASIVFLWLSQRCLWKRAFISPQNPLVALFRVLDRMFSYWNDKLAGGVVLVRESLSLPEDRPIAWREVQKRSLGQFRYLIRVLLVLELPVGLFAMLVFNTDLRSSAPFSALYAFLWIITLTLVVVTASTLVPAERGRETWHVLLTTPLDSQQILREKFAGMWRLVITCMIPLFTCVICKGITESFVLHSLDSRFRHLPGILYSFNIAEKTALPISYTAQFVEYILTSASCIVLYLLLATRLSYYIGLRVTSMARAMMLAMGFIVAWCCLLPMIFVFVLNLLGIRPGNATDMGLMFLGIVSPLVLPLMTETAELENFTMLPFVPFLLNTGFYLWLLIMLNRHIRRQADFLAGRIRQEQPTGPDHAAQAVPSSQPQPQPQT